MSVGTEVSPPGVGGGEEEEVALPEETATREQVQRALLGRALRAVSRLGELMECRGRQAQTGLLACRAVLEHALATADAVEDLAKLSDEQLLARRSRES